MLITIATNDRKLIAKRTGRAKEFAFFYIEKGEILAVDYQKNNHEHHHEDRKDGNHRQGHGHGHGHGDGHEHDNHNHDEVVEQLKNVDVFLVRAVGKNMKRDLKKGEIPYLLVKGEYITEIISNYLKSLSD